MNDKITIDGVEYFRKTDLPREVNRFGLKETLKLLTLLGKIFDKQEKSISEEYAVTNGIWITDAPNVCLVSGKTEQAKRILSNFKSAELEDKPEPKLEYKDEEIGVAISSKYSIEYIAKIIDILDVTDDAVRISIKHDYPIKIENKDFCFILAPRVDGEE